MFCKISLVVVLSLFAACAGWSVKHDPKKEDVQLNTGSAFAVICRVNGVDPDGEKPGLVWTKVDGDIANSGHVKLQRLDDFTLSMFIENGTADDSGVYECHASFQKTTKTTAIAVQYRENIVFLEPDDNIVVPIIGKEARISCQVTGTKPENLMVMWQKEIVALTEDSNKEYIFADNGQTIFIPRVSVQRDSGTFICKVLNLQTGQMLTKNFEIGFPKENKTRKECYTMCTNVCDFLTGSD